MNYRNAKYNETGSIDCEIEHIQFGWIPCTVSMDDKETSTLYARIVSSGTAEQFTPPPPPTNKELIAQAVKHFETAIQSHMDTIARTKGYDSILSAVSYASEVNPFQEEAKQFLKWRGAVWDYAYNQINAYTVETIPTINELIITLPKLEDY